MTPPLFLLLLSLLTPLCASDSPFSAPLASRFSLHTAYRNVYRQRLQLPKDCRPVAVTGVLRGGTAVPDRATIAAITRLLMRLRFDSAPATRTLLQGWKSSFFPEDSGRLTHEGRREADHIGARLQRLLKELHLNWSNSEFAMEAGAAAERLKEAAMVFAQNFQGSEADPARLVVKELPQENLPLYAPCGGTPTAMAAVGGTGEDEVRKFREGRELSYRLQQFNKRHRLGTKFSLDDFLTAFRICADDTAADDDARVSPWCKLFTREDIYAIEYLQDLEQFWRGSYGRVTNMLPACRTAEKMMKMLEQGGKTGMKGQFIFTEPSTFLSLISLLRIARISGALRSQDFPFADARHFRSSHLVPFSANLVLVLLKCKGSPEPQLFPFLNENPKSWANCSAPCPLKKVTNFLAPCAPSPDAMCLATSGNGAPELRSRIGAVLGLTLVAMLTAARL